MREEWSHHRDQLKDTVVWNIEQGARLTGAQLGEAEVRRTALYHRVRCFMERYQFFVLPVSQVLPFAVDQPYPLEVAGVKMATYIDWMKSCYYISTIGHPALSVPCGFSAEGLPVGLQIVGRHQDDWGVLQLGHAFEQATGFWRRRPLVLD
jgi:amidase